MLLNILDKTKYEALPDAIKAEYKASGDTYVLQHDEPAGELKRAKDREKERADNLAVELNTEKSAHAVTKAEATSKGSPLEIATRAKTETLAEVKPKLERLERLETSLRTTTATQTAEQLAVKIGGDKNKIALLPHVAARIDVKLDENDMPQVIVKGADGKPSGKSLTDLETEIRGNKDLSSLVVVGKASGGAGGGISQPGFQTQLPGGGAAKPDLNTMSVDQRAAYIKDNIMQPA